ERRVALVGADAAGPVPRGGEQTLAVEALPEERVEGDLGRAPPAGTVGRRGAQHALLIRVGAVQRLAERLAADQPPARHTGLLGGERLIVDRPLGPEEVAHALVHGRVEAAAEARGQAQHGEWPLGIARQAQHEHLARGARTLEVGCAERQARHRRLLGGGQDRERVEAERSRDLARPEDGASERAGGGVESVGVARHRAHLRSRAGASQFACVRLPLAVTVRRGGARPAGAALQLGRPASPCVRAKSALRYGESGSSASPPSAASIWARARSPTAARTPVRRMRASPASMSAATSRSLENRCASSASCASASTIGRDGLPSRRSMPRGLPVTAGWPATSSRSSLTWKASPTWRPHEPIASTSPAG